MRRGDAPFAVVVVGDIDVLKRGRVAGQTVMVASIVEIGSEVDRGGRSGGAVGVTILEPVSQGN